MQPLTLISFEACPFVQRAVIVLQEQQRDYDVTYVDLANKPKWFLAISPRGQVPVLKVGDEAIFESAVILDYLDETAEQGRLLPDDPVARAQQRMWISYISAIMSKAWLLQVASTEEAARFLVGDLQALFGELSKQLPREGDYWGGATYTMMDAATAPIMQRLTWAERLEPTLGVFEGLPRVQAWRDALLARPSTNASIVPDLEQRSAQMLRGYGSWLARGLTAAA